MKITKLIPPSESSFVVDNFPIKSNILFGALANSFVDLFEDQNIDAYFKLFQSGGISSVFPALKIGKKEIFFVPKPFLPKKSENSQEEFMSKKKIKRIKWLSLNVLQKLSKNIVQSNGNFFHTLNYINGFSVIGNEFLVSNEELEQRLLDKLSKITFMEKRQDVKVTLSRFGHESTPFDLSHILLHSHDVLNDMNNVIEIKPFLYFFEDIKDEKVWRATKQNFIENGIGGKRSIGNGWFTKFMEDELMFEESTKPDLYLILSTFIPKKEELAFLNSYQLSMEDGFITFDYATTIKKDPLYYLEEGSLVTKKVIGKIVLQKFKDKHIYRYGKAMLLPLGGFDV